MNDAAILQGNGSYSLLNGKVKWSEEHDFRAPGLGVTAQWMGVDIGLYDTEDEAAAAITEYAESGAEHCLVHLKWTVQVEAPWIPTCLGKHQRYDSGEDCQYSRVPTTADVVRRFHLGELTLEQAREDLKGHSGKSVSWAESGLTES